MVRSPFKPKLPMKKFKFPILLPLVVGVALTGCAPKRPVHVGPQVATGGNLYYGAPTTPPPKNQKDVKPPPPGRIAQWWFIPGHWVWRGQWVWVAGHWRPRPHPGDIWLRGKWEKQGNVYVWKRGHWRSGAPADEESNEVK